ncbi:MAG: RNA methyltransferase, partial [Erythrobacter sp. 34-65-8]
MTERVVNAASGQDITAGELLPTHLSPPRSRRRATLHAIKGGGKPVIGFREGGAHRIVDMRECHILRPEMFAAMEALRAMLSRRKGKYSADIELVLVDQGVDCALRNLTVEGLQETEAMLDFARDNG